MDLDALDTLLVPHGPWQGCVHSHAPGGEVTLCHHTSASGLRLGVVVPHAFHTTTRRHTPLACGMVVRT